MFSDDHPAAFTIDLTETDLALALECEAARALCGVNMLVSIPAAWSTVFNQRDIVSHDTSLKGFT